MLKYLETGLYTARLHTKRMCMKKLMSAILIFTSCIATLYGQQQSTGFAYQAQLLDPFGQVLSDKKIVLTVGLLSKDKESVLHYSEIHETVTNVQGEIAIVIGRGQVQSGKFEDIPWAVHQIWLDVALHGSAHTRPKTIVHDKLFSVPYVIHADKVSRLSGSPDPVTEKSQSIYWATAGNTKTSPPTHFLGTRDTQDLVIRTNNIPRLIFTHEGQTKILSGVDGESDTQESYPLTISGSHQGIYISVSGSRNGENDFVTFADDEGVWGRIEGQTIAELDQDWEFILGTNLFAFDLAAQIATLVTSIDLKAKRKLAYGSCSFAASGALGVAANLIALVIELEESLRIYATSEVNTRAEIGVTYETGAGDYAEWLERDANVYKLSPGEVVGVRAGKVSLNTQGADHYMVVSTKPAFIGNAPDSKGKAGFEQIAFMGQVPVKIAGVVKAGDFIIPSGNHDGFGIGIAPEVMQTGDYAKIIGVAWENSPQGAAFSYINTAVGIHSNDLASRVDALNNKVDKILAYLEGSGSLEDIEKEDKPAVKQPETTLEKQLSDEDFDKLVEHLEPYIRSYTTAVLNRLEKAKHSNEKIGQAKFFLEDPVSALKNARRNPRMVSLWGYWDSKMTNIIGR